MELSGSLVQQGKSKSLGEIDRIEADENTERKVSVSSIHLIIVGIL
jgi:hypothetical protein